MDQINIADLLSPKDLGRYMHLDPRTFRRWNVEPKVRQAKFIYYDLMDIFQFLLDREKENWEKAREKGELENGSLDYEKFRLTKAQADAQELKNEQTRDEVASVELIVFVLAKIAAQTSSILDGLPLNYFRKHPDLTIKQQESLKLEIAKTMNVIANVSDSLDDILNEYFAQAKEST